MSALDKLKAAGKMAAAVATVEKGSSSEAPSSVMVAVRCRPFNSREISQNEGKIVIINGEGKGKGYAALMPPDDGPPREFHFDFTYDDDSVQEDVYQNLGAPLLEKAFGGWNGTIFAYGQTGAGKSFSMTGAPKAGLPGIIPQMNAEMFDRIALSTDANPDKKFLVTCSFMEIYNEVLYDLLDPTATRGANKSRKDSHIDVKEDPKLGVYVAGLQEIGVDSKEKIEKLMDQGNGARAVAATAMNATSSRSHSIFIIRLQQKEVVAGNQKDVRATINLVDLAGSERAAKTGATGDKLKEGANINKSLSALGNVINALAEQAKKGKKVFVPYRNSKLTRVLQESLGGNSVTVMLAAISPAAYNFEETLNTLQYADRAKAIQLKARKNEQMTEVGKLKKEIEELKAQLEAAASAAQVIKNEANAEELREAKMKLAKLQAELQNSRQERKEVERLKTASEKMLLDLKHEKLFLEEAALKGEEQVLALQEENDIKDQELMNAREAQMKAEVKSEQIMQRMHSGDERSHQLQTDLDKVNAKYTEAHEEVVALEEEKYRMVDDVEVLEEELEEAHQSTKRYYELVIERDAALTSLKDELKKAKQVTTRLEYEKELAELHRECLDKATAYEEDMSSHNEELKALAEAKKILLETTGGAKKTLDLAQESFLQVASKAKSQGQGAQALHVVRRIALTYHNTALIELANHIEKVVRSSALTGGDPFGKVKAMVTSMIHKLEKEAESEASKKAYCDKEMGETQTSKEDKEGSIEKLNIQIDVLSADIKSLKAEVARLEKELGSLARTQAEMDKLRFEEKAIYSKNKPVLEQGLDGVKKALAVLRDYFAQDSGSSGGGAAGGIIGMLEVVESDFSKGLAEMMSSEESAQAEYDAATNENKVAQAVKEKDVKYKTAEYVSYEKGVTELESDKTGVKSELDAVLEYFASLKKDCVAKPDSFEERAKRREDEMAGLREALNTLGADASLVQSRLRGHAQASMEPDASED